MNTPVGVFIIKLADGRNHLRLKPKPEFHTKSVDFFAKSADSVGQFLFINKPVAQRCCVVVPFAEPAVVKHHKLNAAFSRLFCYINDFLLVKIKIGRFPVVDKTASVRVPVFTPAKAVSVKAVINSRHLAYTL